MMTAYYNKSEILFGFGMFMCFQFGKSEDVAGVTQIRRVINV